MSNAYSTYVGDGADGYVIHIRYTLPLALGNDGEGTGNECMTFAANGMVELLAKTLDIVQQAHIFAKNIVGKVEQIDLFLITKDNLRTPVFSLFAHH